MITVLLSLLPLIRAETTTPNTGDQIQSFLFGFTNSHLVIPITSSCPTPLTLTPLTPTNAKTSDPKAPYTMVTLVHEQLIDGNGIQYERLYSASLDVGDMSKERSISHPWMNGTQFIACIWGSNGASGGCQDLMTVVPSEETFEAYSTPNSTCRTANVLESWVPPANETLEVEVMGSSGEVSWNAWPGVCTDLQINPKNGTPPYTLLVAPAAHPPVNITSSTLPINYTVRLTHGQAFMLSLYDSSGNSWAFGPLHAGDNDDLSCLAVATGQKIKNHQNFGVGLLAGTVSGSFIIGALGAAVLMWFLFRGKKGLKRSSSQDNLYSDPRPASYATPAHSFMGKPLSPTVTPYTDSPQLDFDTPATLYDPHVPGPSPQGYPKPPNDSNGNSFSVSSRERAFPRPPILAEGSFSGGEYRDTISLNEYNTRPQGERRESSASAQQGQAQGQGSPGHSPGRPTGHTQDQSRTSTTSNRTSRRPASNSLSNANPVPVNINTNPPSVSSSPRPGSFGTNSIHHEEPSSPSSIRGNGISGPRNVYVVHSDAGGTGDVHIQLPDNNSRVIELPPNYRPVPSPSNDTHHQHSPQPSPGLPQAGNGPYTNTEASRSRNSGLGMNVVGGGNEVTEEELRARAQARLREKFRDSQ
ncbi:uncharacterized protein IL334_001688 [Kwoniella shivajii]|uniref:Uncharacterized protein n=1 Tax=Kwoniella shivajii TaxID=564305 RepID=A0ABZ1CTU7_9TREE|nr:hypothetical protein IL334_001688 [Kwoniella shivajii]